MRWTWLVAAAVLLLSQGCSGKKAEPTRDLTEHQRDSILAKSALPGASAVGAALHAADRESARGAGLDAQVDTLPR